MSKTSKLIFVLLFSVAAFVELKSHETIVELISLPIKVFLTSWRRWRERVRKLTKEDKRVENKFASLFAPLLTAFVIKQFNFFHHTRWDTSDANFYLVEIFPVSSTSKERLIHSGKGLEKGEFNCQTRIELSSSSDTKAVFLFFRFKNGYTL